VEAGRRVECPRVNIYPLFYQRPHRTAWLTLPWNFQPRRRIVEHEPIGHRHPELHSETTADMPVRCATAPRLFGRENPAYFPTDRMKQTLAELRYQMRLDDLPGCARS
jgi:hypothetical protein